MSTLISRNKKVEQEIISLMQQDDQQAISKAYRSYSSNLFGAISSIVREEKLAQEILQDTFIKIWNNRKKFDPAKGRLFTWMINIARHTAIDATRTKMYKQQNMTSEIDSSITGELNWTVRQDVVDMGLAKVINQLDEKYRKIIYLAYYQGYTHKELEEKLNLPLGTVKSRIRLAIKILREQLAKEKELGLLGLTIFTIINLLFS